jgi:chromosomal replication initiator protein
MTDIWSEALEGLQPRLGAQTFDLWLRPLALRQVERERVHITAPNRFMKEWFETHYLNVVRDEIRARTSRNYDIQVEVHEVEEPAPAPAALAPTGAISVTDLTATAASPTSTTTAPRHSFPPPLLSPRYRFDTFIKGAGNELAASATWAAAQEPGTPLQSPLHLRRRRPRQDPPPPRPRPPHPPRRAHGLRIALPELRALHERVHQPRSAQNSFR